MRNDYHDEEYLSGTKKELKQQRKIISSKDRSKYKKSDKDQLKKALQAEQKIPEHLPRGRVISIASEGITVDADGRLIQCQLRGILKKEKTQLKNLVVVGDFVRFEWLSDNEGAISYVEPRTSVLSRADTLSQRKEHLIAANIDQVLITTSIGVPVLRVSLVDRYIIATQKEGMNPIIVVNKIDLLEMQSQHDNEVYQECVRAYKKAGIPLISVSTFTGEGLTELREAMKDRTSVFAGQSGVGKSSLINAVTGLDLPIGDTVDKTKKGSHTTTTAQLIPLSFGGWCIDTPGIKSFGLWSLKQEDIQAYYDEIFELSPGCKYPNCQHLHEPDCAVKEAVDKGLISHLRYDSYQSLMASLAEEHLRR